MPNQNRSALAVAALSVELNLASGQPPKEFRLFPAGRFRAADGSGRPANPAAGWLMNATAAQRLIGLKNRDRLDIKTRSTGKKQQNGASLNAPF